MPSGRVSTLYVRIHEFLKDILALTKATIVDDTCILHILDPHLKTNKFLWNIERDLHFQKTEMSQRPMLKGIPQGALTSGRHIKQVNKREKTSLITDLDSSATGKPRHSTHTLIGPYPHQRNMRLEYNYKYEL